jgi:hypothetical protein
MEGLAGLVAEKHPDLALRAAGAADALRSTLARPATHLERRVLEKWLEPARQLLGASVAQAAWLRGHSQGVEDTITELLGALDS